MNRCISAFQRFLSCARKLVKYDRRHNVRLLAATSLAPLVAMRHA